MLNKKDEQAFIEKYCFEGVTYDTLSKELKIRRKDVGKVYKSLKPKIDEIQKIKRRFNDQRRKDFEESGENVKSFYKWLAQQKKCCHYCSITQDDLYKLFTKDNKKILPLNDAEKRSSGTLEIDKKDPNGKYTPNNMVLACPLCNNAKSNLIDEKSWRNFFTSGMKKYYQTLLSKVKK